MTGTVTTLPVVHRSREAEMEAEAREVLREVYPHGRMDAVEALLRALKDKGFRIVRFVQNGPPQ
jgi:hypothetical protein